MWLNKSIRMIESAQPKFQELIVRISFDPATLHQSRSGSITGVVYFEFGPERQFPSLGWNDFVVVLASWWMVALKEVAEGAPEVKLYFMDGPYWITVVSQEGGLLLRCTEDRRGAGVVYELRAKLGDLERFPIRLTIS
jgi:hypothetical protein